MQGQIGLKSRFLDNKVQLNLAGFSVEYDGFQANNFVLLNGAVVTNLTNAFIGAVDKLARAVDADLGRVKDRNGRDTIRAGMEE